MKNPLKHLKHMWKDPISTIDEANARKKEVLPWLFGSIGVAVLGTGLSNINGLGFLMILGLVGIFGVMAFGFMLFIIVKAKEKFGALTCNNCNTMATIKTPEEYESQVSYVYDVAFKAEYEGISHPQSNNGVISEVRAKAHASVAIAIDLKCANCGTVKRLEYVITPFKCSIIEKKVLVRDVELVKMRLENAVKEVVNDFNDLEKRAKIPFTIHSIHNPQYENRTKPQVGTGGVAYPHYNGVKIDYHRTPEEMIRGFFLENELNGKIIDPSKPKKSK